MQGLDRPTFILRLAHHYDQVNFLHPFREGNGRTQRLFWDRIAGDAGWYLNWEAVRGETNDHACRAASEGRDFGPMYRMLDQITLAATEVEAADAEGPSSEHWRRVPPAQGRR
ncbi:hypothetical protein Kisp02_67290 [Kineosporia sp. NBRC 101731]|nr:hypothetical protein Kisp02_67290 [Kineosporia sp. NBRC 101731]